MERSLSRSGARMRSSRVVDNQDVSPFSVSKSSSSSPEDRGRDILLGLLRQITEFLERKEMMSTRVAASKEWRKSRSRRRSESSNNLFEVVIQVCEQRMRRLKRSTSGDYGGREEEEWSAQSPRLLVAEAIVQELLVSLMELRMKEKERMVMDEVESVEIMRQLHVHLQKDEELVRSKVCIGAGDEQQLEELQLMLRTDFLEEVAGVESPQKKQQADSAANNEASLQFAWETIDDQKKEIIRLRAENERLKRLESSSDASSASFFDDEPAKVIGLLRSQLSSHHDKNLDILHDHIQKLEKALENSTASSRKARRGWDGSKSTFESTRSHDKDDWSSSLLSRSTVGTDFSRTTSFPQKMRKKMIQLRAHAATDEESLLQAEKDRGHLQRENSALSSALLSAKQKQEELRQMILDLTQEKHQLQNLGDAEQRTCERSIRVLKEQLDALEEQKAHLKRKFDDLVGKYDAEASEKRAFAMKYTDLNDTHTNLTQSTAELEKQVASLHETARRCETMVGDRDTALKDLQDQLSVKEQDGAAQITELQEKETQITDLKIQLSELQRSYGGLEVEKRRSAGEIERLLQTLDECKRKNQRLEKGFEELKQGKEFLASLQKVERGASALQLSELQQTRERVEALKLQLSAAKSEHSQLEQALSGANEAKNIGETQHNAEMERTQRELDTVRQQCLSLEQELKNEKAALENAQRESCERVEDLSQELAESKTTMLMWMNKYNTLSEDKQALEHDVQSLSEEQYSLQRSVEELQADSEAQTHDRIENEAALKGEISSLTEQHRTMEREKKALVKLVQTLQARPELQQRAFREMLMACQRGTERSFCQLSERVNVALKKLSSVEKRYQTLRSHLAARKVAREDDSASDEGECRVAPKPASPQIVVQDEDFLSSTAETIDALEMDLRHWKWKFFVQCLVANSTKQANNDLTAQLRESFNTVDHLKKSTRLLAWHKLKIKLENQQLHKLQYLSVVLARQQSKKLLLSQQTQYFDNWKHRARVQKYRAELNASANGPLRPSFSPTTTMALANCIQLVRKFCEPARKNDKGGATERAKSSQTRGADELTDYLVEINTKVASWKVAVDRKIAEYTERNKQLKSVQRRCAELKDLVGLNQRLIEEMERRSAGQQSVVEAAWDFATAYKALSPSARAQVFQSRDFLSASKGIVEGLNSLGLPRSVNKLSQTLGSNSVRKTHGKKVLSSNTVNFHSASAAPGVTSSNSSMIRAEKSQQSLNDSNIELLEDAVGSLRGAMQKQRKLQSDLKEKERSLTITTKELQRRNLQFLMLRSFLQWKCASSNRVRRKGRQHVAPTHDVNRA
ncbi:uncharacterized protein PITG_03214 [Phytophthora infestans T30-4]|uniref:Uncharacterized protein n=1 Tax=Phytophthora infestans (strain T30-4) TaxID=403677 RepID=D0MZN3_PHYIT|nr:uncharacterized protein PITG_03214 [Phytophthora infestans T30-4]EEY65696.1 conserved hypothetical protein [Phytophthora infestans T30-4]|eukprot:XP_002906295.1 conserved hypothetical protein [Phytophthora infestans T30-4]